MTINRLGLSIDLTGLSGNDWTAVAAFAQLAAALAAVVAIVFAWRSAAWAKQAALAAGDQVDAARDSTEIAQRGAEVALRQVREARESTKAAFHAAEAAWAAVLPAIVVTRLKPWNGGLQATLKNAGGGLGTVTDVVLEWETGGIGARRSAAGVVERPPLASGWWTWVNFVCGPPPNLVPVCISFKVHVGHGGRVVPVTYTLMPGPESGEWTASPLPEDEVQEA